MIFDTHAHYDDEAFDTDREELLASIQEQGVGRIVNVSANLSEIERTLELTRRYPFIYGAAGVHPDDTSELNEENFSQIRDAALQDKMLAIGEIGLDYYWDKTERKIQQKWFLRQLELAGELDKPVIIHSREAAQDTLDLIKSAGGADFSMVMHCFSYGKEMAREYLNMGYYLGIGGVVTFKNAKKLKEVVSYMPLDRILLETDAPYLTPVPFRGKRNSSEKIRYVAEEVARLKEISEAEVLKAAWENACRFYRVEN
ncbi:MAG: TatD family hydrolase [Lachnospiraceae bacterium]|nr:TatD family hydrolase [Lachnospiraceae bacterium]